MKNVLFTFLFTFVGGGQTIRQFVNNQFTESIYYEPIYYAVCIWLTN